MKNKQKNIASCSQRLTAVLDRCFFTIFQQPLPPKKPPRRNVSVSPVRTHSSGSLLETSDYHHLLQASTF
jgi:hypothetical protein